VFFVEEEERRRGGREKKKKRRVYCEIRDFILLIGVFYRQSYLRLINY
jgi:hypothetical protein